MMIIIFIHSIALSDNPKKKKKKTIFSLNQCSFYVNISEDSPSL